MATVGSYCGGMSAADSPIQQCRSCSLQATAQITCFGATRLSSETSVAVCWPTNASMGETSSGTWTTVLSVQQMRLSGWMSHKWARCHQHPWKGSSLGPRPPWPKAPARPTVPSRPGHRAQPGPTVSGHPGHRAWPSPTVPCRPGHRPQPSPSQAPESPGAQATGPSHPWPPRPQVPAWPHSPRPRKSQAPARPHSTQPPRPQAPARSQGPHQPRP